MFSKKQDSYVDKIKDTTKDAANKVSGSPSGLGYDGRTRLLQAASTPGVGAEQDRYAGHFSLDTQRVLRAKDAIFHSGTSGAEQDRYQARFGGLGHDGLQRFKAFVNKTGVGAEQERYEGHFGLDDAKIEKTVESVKKGLSK
jgi:hypothetical protein